MRSSHSIEKREENPNGNSSQMKKNIASLRTILTMHVLILKTWSFQARCNFSNAARTLTLETHFWISLRRVPNKSNPDIFMVEHTKFVWSKRARERVAGDVATVWRSYPAHIKHERYIGLFVVRVCDRALLNWKQFDLTLQMFVDVVILDFEKAFHTEPHDRLLNKLEFYGVQGGIAVNFHCDASIRWLLNYIQTYRETMLNKY